MPRTVLVAQTAGIPADIAAWIKIKGGSNPLQSSTAIPGSPTLDHSFVVTSVPVGQLAFKNHQYNPRNPSKGRVNELRASVTQLGLLSPLTCAFIPNSAEEVVLIDGRHRFDALQALAGDDPTWAARARIDLKIYYGLEKSDLFQLATYLNRTRKSLAKGEYYKVIVHIYEEKKKELEGRDGKPRTEREVFREVGSQAITDRDFDLSVGRIVGMVAFDEEEDDSWYPFVGTRQQERVQGSSRLKGYCPMTAGNLASFLRDLCHPKPYDDTGKVRATEITNVLELGRIFRKHVIDRPVKSYDEPTGVSICCKHWCIVAFGGVLHDSKLFAPQIRAGVAPLANPDPPWEKIREAVQAYRTIMNKQAQVVNEYKSTDDPTFLQDAWSYQTQREQVKRPLEAAFKDEGLAFLARTALVK